MNTEPVLTVAGINAAISAVLGMLTAFGLNLSAGQTSAIMAVAGIVATLALAAFARSKVSPTP